MRRLKSLLSRPNGLIGGVMIGLVLLAALALPAAHAQQPTITPNYKDADLRQIVEAVGEVTGKNFLIDPRVDAKVTMLSARPTVTPRRSPSLPNGTHPAPVRN